MLNIKSFLSRKIEKKGGNFYQGCKKNWALLVYLQPSVAF